MNGGCSAGRLFVGVPLEDGARAEIAAWVRAAAPGGVPGRAGPAANWHLTLRFLGPATRAPVQAVRDHLASAGLGDAFAARFGGLGAFPRPRSARVLWMGIGEGADGLRALAAHAEAAARAAGFPPEDRPYRPHLTLARIAPPRDVTALVARAPAATVEVPIREIVLFRSHLGAGPARYEPVARVPLS